MYVFPSKSSYKAIPNFFIPLLQKFQHDKCIVPVAGISSASMQPPICHLVLRGRRMLYLFVLSEKNTNICM
jgi:hypothetical protein